MNIFAFELKRRLLSGLLWGLGLVALQIMLMAFFPLMADSSGGMDLILEYYPEEMLRAFGLSEIVSLGTIEGYFSFIYPYTHFCLAIQAAYYGFQFLSVEEREKTADFLLSMPVSRQRIFLSKYFSVWPIMLITHAFLWAGVYLSLHLFADGQAYPRSALYLLLSTSFIFSLFFFSAGMLVTVLTRRIRSVIGGAMALSGGMYVVNAVRAVLEGDTLGLMTPFYHFEASHILRHSEMNGYLYLISVLFICLSFPVSFILYKKREFRGG